MVKKESQEYLPTAGGPKVWALRKSATFFRKVWSSCDFLSFASYRSTALKTQKAQSRD